eukprot:scaffold2022_cov261-Pinguiococcus_pyrenoidosus.AAC.10
MPEAQVLEHPPYLRGNAVGEGHAEELRPGQGEGRDAQCLAADQCHEDAPGERAYGGGLNAGVGEGEEEQAEDNEELHVVLEAVQRRVGVQVLLNRLARRRHVGHGPYGDVPARIRRRCPRDLLGHQKRRSGRHLVQGGRRRVGAGRFVGEVHAVLAHHLLVQRGVQGLIQLGHLGVDGRQERDDGGQRQRRMHVRQQQTEPRDGARHQHVDLPAPGATQT